MKTELFISKSILLAGAASWNSFEENSCCDAFNALQQEESKEFYLPVLIKSGRGLIAHVSEIAKNPNMYTIIRVIS